MSDDGDGVPPFIHLDDVQVGRPIIRGDTLHKLARQKKLGVASEFGVETAHRMAATSTFRKKVAERFGPITKKNGELYRSDVLRTLLAELSVEEDLDLTKYINRCVELIGDLDVIVLSDAFV
jgi:hypothetical protein